MTGTPADRGTPADAGGATGPATRAQEETETGGLARTSAVMAAGTVVSRVLGMVRAALQTAVLGALTLAANGWEVANSLPNIVFLLLAGGVLNAVLVPQITRAASHPDGGRDYVDRLLTLSLTVLLVLTVGATLAAGLLVRAYASGFDQATYALSTSFALICLPQIFFYGLYTLLGQVLTARGQFAAYMWAPVLANVVAIAGLVTFLLVMPTQVQARDWTPAMVWLLAGSATAGVAAQALVLLVPLWRSGFRFRPRFGVRGVGLRSVSRVALWTFAALAVSQLGFVVTSQVLTSVAAEQPGRYAYGQAFLLFMLPHSLVTVSLVTALFTRMSHAAHARDLAGVRRDVRRGLGLAAVATVPASVGGIVLGTAVTGTLYLNQSRPEQHGIAGIMMAMLAGLVPFGVLYLLQRVFYAFEDARTPFLLQVVVTVVATAVNLGALWLPDRWVGVAIGAGQSVSNLAGAVVGLVLVRRLLGGLPLALTVRTHVRVLVASLAAAAVTWPVVALLDDLARGRWQGPVLLAAGGAVFAAAYLLLATAMRVRELADLLGPLLRRARRTGPPG